MARAIWRAAPLLLVDEPTKGLAPSIIQNLVERLPGAQGQQTTILLVEQNFRRPRPWVTTSR